MEIEANGKTFHTTRGLARQAWNFFQQKRDMDAIRPPTVYVHGDGLVANLMRENVRQ